MSAMQNICQSCGMPLAKEEDCGTNDDGSRNDEYCRYCYKDGQFTANVTMDEFVERQIRIAKEKLGMPEEQARAMAHKTIPTLGRWKGKGDTDK